MPRNFTRRTVSALLLGLLAASAVTAQTPTWPTKPIRLVVPYTPAGGTDILGRMLGRRLADALGVPVLIDNRPGSDGSIGSDIVAKAPPDGYTLLIDGTSQAYNVAFGKKLPYDSARDLAPIVQTANQQVLLLVNAKLPVRTVAELIDYAKANPGKLSYGASSNANALPMELLKSMTGIDIVHVPYKGSGPMLNDLLGGQVELAMSGAAAPLPHVKAGKLRVLGIGDDQRSPSLPEFPTIAEAGVPGFQTIQWSGMYAPQGTPRPIIDRINQEVLAILRDPAFKQQMVDAGFDVVSGPNTPERWGGLVAAEVTKWSRIAKMVGLKAD
ncbi:MAG: tripartite tricarboxylate transporter substrate binding protein [Variovorax sp.]|nr:MAG: tripartite tricarboxylate transporter substrate binding protein [Variovorax sp.]